MIPNVSGGLMLKETGSSKVIKNYFKKNKLGKMTDFFRLLNTTSRMTVYRRLQDVQYLASYTHAGSYYTLKNIPDFNSSNLWYFNGVGFSKYGNLKETVLHLIEQSEFGSTHDELKIKLHVRVHNTLLDLVKLNKITRMKVNGEYIYSSIKLEESKKKILNRKLYLNGFKYSGLSDGIVIEILASIIRSSKSKEIISSRIHLDLKLRGIDVEIKHIDEILEKLDLKKTLGYQ